MDASTHPSQIDEKRDLRAEFFHMSVIFAVGHGAATTSLVYASSVLDTEVAYLCNGTLYILTLFSSLLFAVPVVGTIGVRRALVIGVGLYAIYVGTFSLAAMSTTPWMQGVFFIPGSMCGGVAAGLLWTAQGGYLAHCGSALSLEEKQPREVVNSQLATQFAFYYLLFEMFSKILWSFLMMGGLSVPATGLLYTAVTVGSAYAMTWVGDLQKSQAEKPVCAQLLGVARLWPDVRIWLLSPTNLTFGVAAAFMNGYFNAHIASKVLGAEYIGYLTAFTVFTSCAMTMVYGRLAQRFGNIVPMSIGAASFAGIPILMTVKGCCRDWGWWILIFYALQGSGRSVFENANKANFADTFKGADAEGAFANVVLQMGASSAACFFMSAVIQGWQLQVALLILASLMPILYIMKKYMDPSEDSEDDPLLEKAA